MTKNNLQVLDSDAFKDFQASLQKTRSSPVSEVTDLVTSVDVIGLLDKYSNVLVDMIGSKMKLKESLTD